MERHYQEVQIGRHVVGERRPILIQSMLSRPLGRRDLCRREVQALLDAGCDTIRVALAERRSLDQFLELKGNLPTDINWIADVHFQPQLALEALPHFHKVRINPGNFAVRRRPPSAEATDFYGRELEAIGTAALEFFARARDCGTAVRIGVNEGSLSKRLLATHGDRSMAMVQSALEMTSFAAATNFRHLIYSFKSSDVLKTVAVNRLAREKLAASGWNFPFHLGVTESGFGIAGRVKSAIGIGALLSEGIGHTIRVSLSEPVENEVRFAHGLLDFLNHSAIDLERLKSSAKKMQMETNSVSPFFQQLAAKKTSEDAAILEILDWILSASAGRTRTFPREPALFREIVETILQVCGHGNFQAEIVSCPTCGRTRYDVAGIARQVKARFSHLRNLRIAVMGCIVNGLGEMGDADYAYVGTGNGKVSLYRNGNCCHRNIDQSDAINLLEKLIEKDHHFSGARGNVE